MFERIVLVAVVLAAAGCASTAITPIPVQSVVIAETCGARGVEAVAIATIRRGYTRFIVMDEGPFGPERTRRDFHLFGDTVFGPTAKPYRGEILAAHRSPLPLRVAMLNPGDTRYVDGVDARRTLGLDWERKVADGMGCL